MLVNCYWKYKKLLFYSAFKVWRGEMGRCFNCTPTKRPPVPRLECCLGEAEECGKPSGYRPLNSLSMCVFLWMKPMESVLQKCRIWTLEIPYCGGLCSLKQCCGACLCVWGRGYINCHFLLCQRAVCSFPSVAPLFDAQRYVWLLSLYVVWLCESLSIRPNSKEGILLNAVIRNHLFK